MSFSLKLRNGDLNTSGSAFAVASGTEKLIQDLDCWLRERYQVDRFHTSYGSTLDSYIGGVVSDEIVFYLRTEALRVLSNYQQVQLRKFEANPELFTQEELLNRIVSVEPELSYDTVILRTQIETAAFRLVSLTTSINI